jgi:diguanylate cyclase (GGDEF)-like protein
MQMKNATRLGKNKQGRVCVRCFLELLAIVFMVLLSSYPSHASPATQAGTKSAKKLPTLTTALQAHSLNTTEAARAYPIHLRAVVTYYDPNPGNGFVSMFVNDGTSGIWVNLPTGRIASLTAGTLVDVTGVSSNGMFAPVIASPQVRIIGHSHLPKKAIQVSYSNLFSGLYDSDWVEVEGVIHSVSQADHTVTLHLQMPGGNVNVVMVRETGMNYSSLVDATVLVRGNAAPVFSRVKFQMVGMRVMSPGVSSIKILEPAPSDPFNRPVVPVDSLLRWDHISLLAHRVHLRGVVTLFWPGSYLCLRDTSGTICARTKEQAPLAVNRIADVAGFAGIEEEAQILTDAVYRSVDKDKPAAPTPITAYEIMHGLHDSELVVIEGELISRDHTSSDITLLLKTGNGLFTAVLPKKLSNGNQWKNGSKLRITGICSVSVDAKNHTAGEGNAEEEDNAVAKSFRILMRSPADVVVVQRASWWTAAHLLVVLALALFATLLVLAWVAVLRRRVEEQRNLLRESEKQFRRIAMHDALTGVATRTLLQDRLDIAVESVRRRKTGLAFLILDCDKFKQVNDTYGHQAGDEVLRVTARRLREIVRKSDTVARFGGDEFVVLLPDLNGPQAAEVIAENIVKKLGIPISFNERLVPVSVSVGLSIAFATEVDADTLMKNADIALYYVKAHGRNNYRVFTPDLASDWTL